LVACFSGESGEFHCVLIDEGPLHPQVFSVVPSSLVLLRVHEGRIELGDELTPRVDVIVKGILDVKPLPHISGPFLDQWSLDQSEGKGDPGVVGSKGLNLVIESEVRSQAIYK
jgi:hypothetical protein